jgi:hypothetical protein
VQQSTMLQSSASLRRDAYGERPRYDDEGSALAATKSRIGIKESAMFTPPECIGLLEIEDGVIVGKKDGRMGWLEIDEYKEYVSRGYTSKTMKVVYCDTTVPEMNGEKSIILLPMPVSGRQEQYQATYDNDSETWYFIPPRQSTADQDV